MTLLARDFIYLPPLYAARRIRVHGVGNAALDLSRVPIAIAAHGAGTATLSYTIPI